MAHEQQDKPLVLPTLVFGVVEVRRLIRELDALEEYMKQAELRVSGRQASLPRVSRLLESLAAENYRNLLQPADRQALRGFLASTERSAPVLHFSFASDPSSSFLAKLVMWLRGNIHPVALVSLGLQPSIAAGCVVRTANKSFDFSLRHRLSEQGKHLAAALQPQQAAAQSQEQSNE